jgi:hypothetical protein
MKGRRRPGSVEDPVLHQFRLENHELAKEAKAEAKKKTKRDKMQAKAKSVHQTNIAEVLGADESANSNRAITKKINPTAVVTKLTWKI